MVKILLSKILIFSLFIGIFGFIFASPAQAAASLYLSPASKTITVNNNFTVSLYVNTGGDNVNAVQANITYPTSKFQYLGVDTSGSGFDILPTPTVGGGVIEIIAGKTSTYVTGTVLVIKLRFKAISTGTASLGFTGENLVSKPGGIDILGGTTGGSYTINTGSSGGGGTTGGGSSGGTGSSISDTSSTTSGDTSSKVAALTVFGIKVTGIGPNTATVTWKTNKLADSTVRFGFSEDLEFTSSNKKLTKNHKVVLDTKVLTPGVTYIYQVESKGKDGQVKTGKLLKFTTTGYGVSIKVIDEQGNPLEGLTVILRSDPKVAVTNENGIAVFRNVSSGEHQVAVVLEDGRVKTSKIDVEKKSITALKSGRLELQGFDVKISTQDFLAYYVTLGILGLMLIALFGYLVYRTAIHHKVIVKDEVIK